MIDSHCHLHDREFFTEEQALGMLERAVAAGVKKVICIGTSHEDSLTAYKFASEHENVYWTYGVHPENASSQRKLEYDFSRDGVAFARRHGESAPHTSTPSGSSVGRRFGLESKLSDTQLLQRSVATSEIPREECSQLPLCTLSVRLRHRAPLIPARFDGETLYFEKEIKRPANGQSAVLYDGEACLGGGIIA